MHICGKQWIISDKHVKKRLSQQYFQDYRFFAYKNPHTSKKIKIPDFSTFSHLQNFRRQVFLR